MTYSNFINAMNLNSERLELWRNDTPGTNNYIHLNNAGASFAPQIVINTIKDYLDLEAQIGGYEAAVKRADKSKEFYNELSLLLGGKPHQYALTVNASDAFNRALYSIDFKEGDVIITTSNDYVSNFTAFLSLEKKLGTKTHIVNNNEFGEVDLQSLSEDLLRLQPKVVAITHIPTNSGLTQPIEEIGEICTNHDAIYIVDGCQSAGQMEVKMEDVKCDFFSATFRKFLRGPRGVGFLYVGQKMLDQGLHPLLLDSQGAEWVLPNELSIKPDASRYELWERSYALVHGATAALSYANDITIQVIESRTLALSNHLRQKLSDIPGIRILDNGRKLGAIVTFVCTGVIKEHLGSFLQSHKINCSIAAPHNAPIDFQEKGVDWAVRFSPHYYNTEQEMEIVINLMTAYMNNSNLK